MDERTISILKPQDLWIKAEEDIELWREDKLDKRKKEWKLTNSW